MRRSLAVAVLALLALFAWFALHSGRDASAPAFERSASGPEAPATDKAAQLESAPVARSDSPAPPASERTAVAEPPPAPAPAPAPEVKLVELRGRFVLAGGVPAAGAKILVEGWEANNERVIKYGRPKEEWKDLRAECDADGRFSLRFDPPRAYQFALDASYPGCVSANWRWSEIEPASTKDLGETVLPRGGSIEGRVVDAQGRSTRDAWQVYAEAIGITKGDDSEAARASTAADMATGQFRLEGMPAGRVQLKAYSGIANWIDGPSVEVHAGETTEANIEYTGPDNSRRITVSTFARSFYIYDSDVHEIVLSVPGKEPRKAEKIAGSSQSFSFDDLEPGSYSITIDDPKFKPWRKDGVQPGQSVEAHLQGASSVGLVVLDAATRAAIPRYALRVRFDHSSSFPNEFEVFGPDRDPPAGGLVEGLIPTDQTMIVVAEGYAPCELQLEGLKPGEQRPLTAEMRHGARLVARVRQADGRTPIAGLTVTLESVQPDKNDHPGVVFRTLSRDKQREASSGADGDASFAAVAAGTYRLRAELTPLLAAEQDGVAIAAADTEKRIDLVLPPNGWLVGRVLGLEGAAGEGCSLVILPTGIGDEERELLEDRANLNRKGPQNPVAADGSFRAGPLRAGKSGVAFQYPSIKVKDGPNSSWTQPGAKIELGEIEIPAGGELRCEFDLRGRLPGRVEAEVRVNGAPASNARVSIRSADGEQRGGVIELDANGRGTSAPIAAGAVRFDLGSSEGGWSWSPPRTWTIASGETLRVSWDVSLVAGSLQLLDAATGKPLALHDVSILSEAEADGFESWVQRTTDTQGRLDLRLVPAGYKLFVQFVSGPDGRPMRVNFEPARFDWTASGSAQPLLKLAKKP